MQTSALASIIARAKRRFFQLFLKETYLSPYFLFCLQNGVNQQFKNQSRGQEAGEKWVSALFWSVPPGWWRFGWWQQHRVHSPMASEHMGGGKKRDEGNFSLLSSRIMQIINTRMSHSLQNYNCQEVTIPLPQIRQLFLSLGKCSPAISVHFSLNTGLRGLNKLKQFTVIAKTQNVFIFQHHMLDLGMAGRGMELCSSIALCWERKIRFLDLNQLLVLKKCYKYADISHTLYKNRTTQGNCALSSLFPILTGI